MIILIYFADTAMYGALGFFQGRRSSEEHFKENRSIIVLEYRVGSASLLISYHCAGICCGFWVWWLFIYVKAERVCMAKRDKTRGLMKSNNENISAKKKNSPRNVFCDYISKRQVISYLVEKICTKNISQECFL